MKKITTKIILFIILFLVLIFFLLVIFQPTKIAVLTYHDFVIGEPENNMQINANNFEEQMRYLNKHHYKTLKLQDIECFLSNKCRLPRKSVLITMDDGWKNELEIAAPILKKYNLNAVIFYVGENIDGNNENFMDKKDLEKLKSNYSNIELASHSYSLHFEDAYLLTKEEISADIDIMKDIIDSKYYAYPYGRSSDNYKEALIEKEYKLAFTFGPDENHRKFTKSDGVYEIPRLNMSNGMPMWKFILRLNWYK